MVMSKRETAKTKEIKKTETETVLMNRIEEAVITTITIIVTIGMMGLERTTLREIVVVSLTDGGDAIEMMKMSTVIGQRSLNISTAPIIAHTRREMVIGIVEWSCRHAACWSVI